MRLIAMLAPCLALLSSQASAGALRVRMESVPCPERAALAAQIEERAASFMADHPDATLIVLNEEGGRLWLLLLGAHHPFEKRIPFSPTDCRELPTLALLVTKSWLDASWKARRQDEGAPEARNPVDPAPLHAATAEAAQRSRWLPSLSVLGGTGSDRLLDRWTPYLSASIGFTPWERWGAQLQGAYEGTLRAGGIEAGIYSLSAAASFGAAIGEAGRLYLMAGPALSLVSTSAQDYHSVEGRLAWYAGARFSLSLHRNLAWSTALEFLGRGNELWIDYAGSNEPLKLPAVRGALSTGFTANFF